MQEQQILQQQQQAMLMQHQQQQIMIRNSPPPGYRSSLDVSGLLTVTTPCSRVGVVPEGMSTTTTNSTTTNAATSDSNGNLSNKQVPTLRNAPNPLLSMKNVLNAQSCCSLQRAEVENMWNAAAAAVAARGANHRSVGLMSTMEAPRKSLPSSYAGAKLTVHELGRRYLQPGGSNVYYRRGCPLCGKFRHDVVDTLSLSTESGLDETVLNNSNLSSSQHNNNNSSESLTRQSMSVSDTSNNKATNICSQGFNENDNCLDLTNSECICLPSNRAANADVKCSNSNDENGNTNITTTFNCQDVPSTSRAIPTAAGSSSPIHELVATTPPDSIFLPSLPAEANVNTNDNNNSNNNNNDAKAESSTETKNNLDAINDNGIIRVDMSKIMDTTGLPHYDAALKLESSGYV